MKNLLLSLFIIFFGATLIISCTKSDLNNPAALTQNLKSNGKVNPDVPYCGIGNHWDFYLGKCVETCPTGYHNDSITGACVLNGGNNIVIITNPNNPNDFEGQSHNLGCSVIIQEINFASPTIWNDVLKDTKSYLYSQGYDSTEFNNWYIQAVQDGYYSLPNTNFTNSPSSLITELYSKGLISANAKNYLNNIFSIIDNTIGNNTPSSILYNSVASQLINLENQISNDNTLSTQQKSGLFSACSVARFSGGYWGEYYLSENSGGSSSEVHPMFLGIHLNLNWKSIWHADVVGAIGGFFSGLFTGGIICNTIGGAIGSSIGEAVVENLN